MSRRLALLAVTVVACRGERLLAEPAAGTAPATGVAPTVPPPRALPCEPNEPDLPAPPAISLTLVATPFSELPGWADDRHAEALPAFLASCGTLDARRDDEATGAEPRSGRVRDWRAACAAARRVAPGDDAAARAFFEAELTPYAAHGDRGPQGKLTGYYVHGLRGSRTRHGRYLWPILGRPSDLVSVELGKFIDDGRGRRIWGRVDPSTGALAPYPSRREIREGVLGDRARAILWTDDPIDAVFAEIEGSGRVTLDDGEVAWIAFAGKNGLRFRGVGGILRGLGELAAGEATLGGIRAWFAAHPERFDDIVDRNPAKVFFKLSEVAGAIGTQGVVLSPRRSMAVDRGLIALSTPVWVDTRAPVAGPARTAPFRQLLIAQDTGGAILGPVRGDIYWGDDLAAADLAGRMGGPGRMWLLLPRGLRVAPSVTSPSETAR